MHISGWQSVYIRSVVRLRINIFYVYTNIMMSDFDQEAMDKDPNLEKIG